MNRLLIVLLPLLFAVVACSKMAEDDNCSNPVAKSFIGKWNYSEWYFSIGGPGQWKPVLPANQFIEFKKDGSFISTQSFLSGANRFELADNGKIKFYTTSSPSGFTLMQYELSADNSELQLYPINPACIEGCSNKFVRMN